MTDKLTPEQQAEKYADHTCEFVNGTRARASELEAAWLAGYRAALAEPAAATLTYEEQVALARPAVDYANSGDRSCWNALVAHVESLLASRLSAARRDALEDGERLEFMCRHMPGDVARRLVGELSDTGDMAEWRAAIDAAIRAKT